MRRRKQARMNSSPPGPKAVAEGGGGMIEMINDFSIYDDIPHAQLDNDLRNEHYDREKDWIKFIATEYLLRPTLV